MPEQSNGLLKGFQLWLNLPKSKKYIEPAYQDIPSDKIPIVKIPGGHIKIIAGSFNNKKGPGKSHTKISYFDIALEPNSSICIPIKDNWNSFCYIYKGKIEIDKTLKFLYFNIKSIRSFVSNKPLVIMLHSNLLAT